MQAAPAQSSLGAAFCPRFAALALYLASKPKMSHRGTTPIDDYAIIGDCRSAALVARDGSIDWLCWPRFDSPSLFAALLDPQIGGHWSLAPKHVVHSSRRYLDATNVLEMSFRTDSGECTLTDCMALSRSRHEATPALPDHEILRCVRCTAGEVEIDSLFNPRPDYARGKVRLRNRGKFGFALQIKHGEVWFRSSQPMQQRDTCIESRFTVRAGE